MTQEELVVAGTMHVVQELEDIKRLEALVEVERQKVARKLQCHLKRMCTIKNALVKLVANESLELRQTDAMCDVIRKINGILGYERSRLVSREHTSGPSY